MHRRHDALSPTLLLYPPLEAARLRDEARIVDARVLRLEDAFLVGALHLASVDRVAADLRARVPARYRLFIDLARQTTTLRASAERNEHTGARGVEAGVPRRVLAELCRSAGIEPDSLCCSPRGPMYKPTWSG